LNHVLIRPTKIGENNKNFLKTRSNPFLLFKVELNVSIIKISK
jgi:hypothetical protein